MKENIDIRLLAAKEAIKSEMFEEAINVSFWEWEKIPRLEAKTSVGLRYSG